MCKKPLEIFKLFWFQAIERPLVIHLPSSLNRSSSGVYNYQVEEDISKLKASVNSLLQEYNLNVNIKDDYIHEL